MRLQKQTSRRVGGKRYEKWVITLPGTIVSKLGWDEGTELDTEAQGELLILRKEMDGEEAEQPEKQVYEEFKKAVHEGLKGEREGLTWGQLRTKQGLKQARPFHDWVRALEKDIGLIRQRKGTQIYWRLP
jgi:bifunctional DNA-binding transcriptional regulator/antitoxin component of YhaV-PrlF toxin-antitoxin module